MAMNLCRSCGEDFNSVEAFDSHRVGKHEYTYSEGAAFDPPVEDGRRCLSAEELVDLGFAKNERNRWYNVARARRPGEAFASRKDAG
jgi:hypothetical protein